MPISFSTLHVILSKHSFKAIAAYIYKALNNYVAHDWRLHFACIYVSPCDMPAKVLSSLLKRESPNGGLHWAGETNSMQSGWLTTIAVHNESHVAG